LFDAGSGRNFRSLTRRSQAPNIHPLQVKLSFTTLNCNVIKKFHNFKRRFFVFYIHHLNDCRKCPKMLHSMQMSWWSFNPYFPHLLLQWKKVFLRFYIKNFNRLPGMRIEPGSFFFRLISHCCFAEPNWLPMAFSEFIFQKFH
jgi:hypothetical protein